MLLLRNIAMTCGMILLLGLLGHFAPEILGYVHMAKEHELLLVFFTLSFLFLLGYFVGVASRLTKIPSFVFALLFGLLTRDLLVPIMENHQALSAIVAIGATLILFGGGLEVPYRNFLRLSPQILSLSFVGLGLTAVLLSFATGLLEPLSPVPLAIPTLILLGAILASTDPAAIIPILRSLRFHNRDVKDIIISESAVTDVTGTLFTTVFLGLFAAGATFTTISGGYLALFTQNTISILTQEILFGVFAGVLGFGILDLLHRQRKNGSHEDASDAAFFIAIPVLTFFLATLGGGSGYLAAFIAGLLMHMTEHLHETEHFFNNLIEAFLKPAIFILLGALVNFNELLQYAGIGIASALIFMVIIRPITVFISLLPWMLAKKQRISWREVLFIASVRETGAIPAVLLVSVTTFGLPFQVDGLIPIGMWIIIATLVLQPPLMPWLSRVLQVGEPMSDVRVLPTLTATSAVLASRGHSHLRRLPQVLEWMDQHGLKRLVIILCPEDDYNDDYAKQLQKDITALVTKVNTKLEQEGASSIEVTTYVQQGMLHDNLKSFCTEDTSVSVLFVGKGVLDFRLGEIKSLQVPFYFLD